MEKQRDNQPQSNNLEHTVTIMGKVAKVKLEKGKKTSDLIAAIKNQFKAELQNFPLNNTTNVVLNGRVLKMNANGELEENPILAQASTLSLMPQITGGSR